MTPLEFIDKLAQALENLVTLDIRTVVGAVDWDKGAANLPGAKEMRSKIRLIGGDITTVIDPAFASGDLQALRDFHLSREKEGAAIIQNNVEVLEKLMLFALKLNKPDSIPPKPVQPVLPATKG